jgi:hypothetical protein
MDYQGSRFAGGTVRLDGNSFTDCVFDGATLAYDGGPVQIVGCVFERIAGWQFGGGLATGLDVLGRLYRGDHEQGLRIISQAMFRAAEPVRKATVQ